MRGRRFKTQADIERYIEQGYGQGEGRDYKPWLRVQDVPSRGRSRKVSGSKVDRVYHLLSDLEFAYFLTLEFSERVIDIREQYPILPVEEAQDIAASLGIKYPNYPGTKVPFVLTTDFLVTYLGEDGQPRLGARTVKYEEDLSPSPDLEWTLQKLEIERVLWMNRVVDWSVVTDSCIGPASCSGGEFYASNKRRPLEFDGSGANMGRHARVDHPRHNRGKDVLHHACQPLDGGYG